MRQDLGENARQWQNLIRTRGLMWLQILFNTQSFPLLLSRLNKRAKPYKPFGLRDQRSSSRTSQLSREQSPSEPISSAFRRSQTPSTRSISSTNQVASIHSRTPSFTQPSAPASKLLLRTRRFRLCKYAREWLWRFSRGGWNGWTRICTPVSANDIKQQGIFSCAK